MDKGAIRSFAIEARKILMKSAITEAGFYGVTKDGCKAPIQKGNDFEVYETLAGTENRIYGHDIKRRANLVKAVQEQGFDQVIEETAYTWFNRIIAIRFMEVNDYLPTRVRVLSSETGSNTPDIVTQSLDVDLNMTPEEIEKVQTAKDNNKYDEAFRLLFIKQCNELNDILPGLFEKTDDYMELLLKLTYTNDGVVRMLIDTIPDDNFNVETEGQVEIIGWMYQYYNTELKDDTFAKLKKNVKISKERIPAATQLFTPDWIVRYIVENSVGRVWIEHLRANDPMVDEKTKAEEYGWKYYLSEAEQDESVQEQLMGIRKSYINLTPKDITCLDPCMGSGHILVYMFEVLMDIYRSEGFNERDAVFSILENNIRGLDIDRRAYQLSYFALMMKAREYNKRFFRGKEKNDGKYVLISPQVYTIEESNSIKRNQLRFFGAGLSKQDKENAMIQLNQILDLLRDAKEYGSLITVNNTFDWGLLKKFIEKYEFDSQISFDTLGIDQVKHQIEYLIELALVLAQKYYIVSTNPPYLSGGMNSKLQEFILNNYSDDKTDIYACFIRQAMNMLKMHGISGLVTMHTWMFLNSFEKLRIDMVNSYNIKSILHLGVEAFEGIIGKVVSTAAFIFSKGNVVDYAMRAIRLTDFYDSLRYQKEIEFFNQKNYFTSRLSMLLNIPGYPIAYWIPDELLEDFNKGKSIGVTRKGMVTADNPRFIRLWTEVDIEKINFNARSRDEAFESKRKWFPYQKGGAYKKWYGNNEYVVNWENDGYELLHMKEEGYKVGSTNYNLDYMFKSVVCWTKISNFFGCRYVPYGNICDDASPFLYIREEADMYYVLGFLCSDIADMLMNVLNPTLNFTPGAVSKLPIIVSDEYKDNIVDMVKEAITLSKKIYDEHELSYNFSGWFPDNDRLNLRDDLRKKMREQEKAIKRIEEIQSILNKLFCEIYGLKEDALILGNKNTNTLEYYDEKSYISELLSYFVGCLFGRYRVDTSGLVYSASAIKENIGDKFRADKDNIIPITDEAYFDDDIVEKLCDWLILVYGEKSLDENLQCIAQYVPSTGDSPKQIIRNYFLKDFYKEHCVRYSASSGKKPIYWLFDSGKENGFKALIYIHRYNKDTVGLIRSDYLHKVQDAIERALQNSEYIISTTTSAVDKARATKARDKYIKQLNELRTYYLALSHVALQRIEIDLDDGVKVNYSKFQGIEISNEGTKKQTIDLLANI